MNKQILLTQYSDRQLLSLFLEDRDSRITGVLYERYYLDVFRYCLYLLKNRNDAFDNTQNIFIKSFEKIYQLKDLDNYGSWLRKIAYNSCMNMLKKKTSALKKSRSNDLFYYINEVDQEVNAEKEILLEKLDVAMSQLSVATSEILDLKYKQNISIIELQAFYNISGSAVKMRLLRAKKRLVRKIERVGAA